MAKVDERVQAVFSGMQKSVEEVSAKCNGLDTRVTALEEQPSSGNSSGTMGLWRTKEDFFKEFTVFLDKRRQNTNDEEEKLRLKGELVGVADVVAYLQNGFEAFGDAYDRKVVAYNALSLKLSELLDVINKIPGLEQADMSYFYKIASDSNFKGLKQKLPPSTQRTPIVIEKVKAIHPIVEYRFSVWEHTKLSMRYLFQKSYWTDFRVIIMAILLVTSTLCAIAVHIRNHNLHATETKYVLLKHFYSGSIVGKNFQYMDSLFVDEERNEETIDRIRHNIYGKPDK